MEWIKHLGNCLKFGLFSTLLSFPASTGSKVSLFSGFRQLFGLISGFPLVIWESGEVSSNPAFDISPSVAFPCPPITRQLCQNRKINSPGKSPRPDCVIALSPSCTSVTGLSALGHSFGKRMSLIAKYFCDEILGEVNWTEVKWGEKWSEKREVQTEGEV